jgi:hypothetical protein
MNQKLIKSVIQQYGKLMDNDLYKDHFDQFQQEIAFYHIVQNHHIKSFQNRLKEINFEILKYVQSNYFYKVVRFRQQIIDKNADDNYLILINKIQFSTIEKTPRTAHLATIKTLNDLYV